jgi:hypothetical protein
MILKKEGGGDKKERKKRKKERRKERNKLAVKVIGDVYIKDFQLYGMM